MFLKAEGFFFVRDSFGATVTEDAMRLLVVFEGCIEDFTELLLDRLVENRHHELDAFLKVPSHPVG